MTAPETARRRVRRGRRLDAADPLPVVRRRATRPSSATAGRRTSPTRPTPRRSSDPEWAEFLFMRDNPKGSGPSGGCTPPAAVDGSTRSATPLPIACSPPTARARSRRRDRAPTQSGGTWIDRSRPIRFTFDGRDVDGFAGDTVASALLASGERAGFVSPLLGRPRGILTAGVEEPNAFVEISEPWFEPIRPATMVNLVDGLRVASRAGVGLLPEAPVDPRPARHVHRHVEVLVIGAGAAGRVAALEAAARDSRVLLVDEHHVVLEPPAGVPRWRTRPRPGSTTTVTSCAISATARTT